MLLPRLPPREPYSAAVYEEAIAAANRMLHTLYGEGFVQNIQIGGQCAKDLYKVLFRLRKAQSPPPPPKVGTQY